MSDKVKAVKQGDYYTVSNYRSSLLVRKTKPGKRGKVTGFSVSSRRRMRKFLARAIWQRALFVTLTSRDDTIYPQLVAWVKRYNRRWGQTPMVWRKEVQKRGVVHWHILIFTRSWLPLKWIKRSWSEIVGSESSVDVGYIDSRSGVGRYISKYMTKAESDAGAERERSDASGGLENSIILCRGDDVAGRWWGYFNRHKFRFYKPVKVTLTGFLLKVYENLLKYMKDNGYVCNKVSFVVFGT